MVRQSAERFCVGQYIQDELDVRGWTTRDCAERMGGDVDVDELTLDLHIACINAPPGHAIHEAMMNQSTADGLERATGVSAGQWMRLDFAYRNWQPPPKDTPT